MELFGKFLSVVAYNVTGAWKNPELIRLLNELRTREITSEDLDNLCSLGALSIQTTTNTNLGTCFRAAVEEVTADEKALSYEKFRMFGKRYPQNRD
jgi:hypothetical protein